MARTPATIVVRLLAGLLTFAVLLTASPLPLLQAAPVVAPVGEETDADAESVASECLRRAAGPGGPPLDRNPSARSRADRFPPVPNPSTRRSSSGSRSCRPFAPHPRC